MKTSLFLILIFALTTQFAFAQCEDCPEAIICDKAEKQAEAPDFGKTMEILSDIADEYAYFKSDTKGEGYTSAYQFNYDAENHRGVFYFTTMVYKGKPVVPKREYSQRDMIPEEHLEFEYIFDFADFDPNKSEIVSWEDDAGKERMVMTQAAPVEDPSQQHNIAYPYYRVTFHTKDNQNLMTVRNPAGAYKTNSVSLYFQDKYYADEFIAKFNHAVKLRQEKSAEKER